MSVESGVAALMVVGVELNRQSGSPGPLGAIGPVVGPFVEEGRLSCSTFHQPGPAATTSEYRPTDTSSTKHAPHWTREFHDRTVKDYVTVHNRGPRRLTGPVPVPGAAAAAVVGQAPFDPTPSAANQAAARPHRAAVSPCSSSRISEHTSRVRLSIAVWTVTNRRSVPQSGSSGWRDLSARAGSGRERRPRTPGRSRSRRRVSNRFPTCNAGSRTRQPIG